MAFTITDRGIKARVTSSKLERLGSMFMLFPYYTLDFSPEVLNSRLAVLRPQAGWVNPTLKD